jgi:Fe-S cluster assembly protein SufD
MTAAEALLERLAPSASPGVRADLGRAWLVRHGLPDRRDEAWHYTPVDDVLRALEAATPAEEIPPTVSRRAVDEHAGDHGGPRLVFVNGTIAPPLSVDGGTPAGLWLGGADGLRPRRPAGTPAPDDEPVDGFHALNWAAGRDVAAVLVDPDVALEAPVHIVHLSQPGGGVTASHPRTVVRVARNSRVHVVESYVGVPGRSLTNASTRIIAAPDATVTYHRVQDESSDAVHLGRTGIEQGAGSTVRPTTNMTGGE